MDTGLMINPEKIAQIQQFCDNKTKAVAVIIVKDAATMAEAMELGQSLKGAINKLEDMRKEAVKPLNEKVKEINNKIKFFAEPLQKVRELLNEKMVRFQREEMAREQEAREEAECKAREEQEKIDAERRAAEKKMADAQRKLDQETLTKKQAEAAQRKLEQQQKELQELREREANQEIMTAMVEPPKKTTRTASGAKVTFAERWDFEIVDVGKIPRDYLIPDERTIRNAVSQGVREIPGVNIHQVLGLRQ